MKSKSKTSSLENELYQVTLFLFQKEIPQSKVLLKLAEISNNKKYHQATCILFSLFNFLISDNLKMAYRCIQKSEQSVQIQNIGSIITLVLKSVLLAEMKQHKESLLLLNRAFDLSQKEDVEQDLLSVYQVILIKLIEIQDMTTFKRQYLAFMEGILEKYESEKSESQVLKSLEMRKNELKKKVCGLTSRNKLTSLNSKPEKSILTLKDSEKGSLKSGIASRQKSSNRSNLYSPRSKLNRNFKKIKYVNPYNLQNLMQVDSCVFM